MLDPKDPNFIQEARKILKAVFAPDPAESRGCLTEAEFDGFNEEAVADPEGVSHQSKLKHLEECETCRSEAIDFGLFTQEAFDD